jgi:hypothetical protein
MTTAHIEPGISVVRDSAGNVVGYLVEGISRPWRTLRAARAAMRRL